MKRMTALFLPVLFIWVADGYALPPATAGYGLAWSDEFNGTSLDTINNWSWDTVDFYNAPTQSYPRSCVTLENGSLVIWSKYNSNGSSPEDKYLSGRIDSHDKKIFTYGYFEASIKAPQQQVSGPGLWSAVWLLGNSIHHGTAWPTCGEMELYEQRPGPQLYGGTPGDNCFIGTCHYGTAGPIYNSKQYNYSECLCNAFHKYGILWDSTYVEYYFDDQLYWGPSTNPATPSILQAVNNTAFHSPFYWIINVAIGGAYQGQNINNAIFPTKMEIDYVRVYQKGATDVGRGIKDRQGLQSFIFVNPSTAQLKVYDLQGKLVADFSSRLKSMRCGDVVMNAMDQGLRSGVYVAKLVDSGRYLSRKFVAAR